MRNEPDILTTDLSWNGTLKHRKSTRFIVIHHAATDIADIVSIHNMHRNLGWSGIGYNFYVRKSGNIYEGRGWDHQGAHTLGYNAESIGICCEGYYHKDEKGYTQAPPREQVRALIKIVAMALNRYNLSGNDVYGHRDLVATACPGNLFPLEIVKNAVAVYNNVEAASYQLERKGIINSPEYWLNCFWELPSLDILLIRLANMCSSINNGHYFSSVSDALYQLFTVGIIDSPDYWQKNYHEIPYLSDLICSAASYA